MFKHKKIVSAILAVSMLGAMSTSVFANNTDRPFYFHASTGYNHTSIETKDNSSSIYCKITEWDENQGVLTVLVNAWGWKNDTQANCNYGGNNRILKFTQSTMIRNSVNEKGYALASLSFTKNTSASGYWVGGVWSPDSIPESGSITI